MKNKNTKYLYYLAISILVLGATIFIAEKIGLTDFYQKPTDSSLSDVAPENTVDYGPPTDQEARSGDTKKQELVNNGAGATEEKSTVGVALVDAGQYDEYVEVRAFINKAIDGDGKCVSLFNKKGLDAILIRKEVDAFIDATTTQCQPFIIELSEFESSGMWEVQVNYSSSDHTGQSEKRQFEVTE